MNKYNTFTDKKSIFKCFLCGEESECVNQNEKSNVNANYNENAQILSNCYQI